MSINQRLINRIKGDLQDLIEQAQDYNLEEKIDLEFHLRAIKEFVEKSEKPFGEGIKVFCLERSLTVKDGIMYQANINRIEKTTLDTERVKSFLGKRLPDFQVERSEVHLKIKQRFV